jgi:hypothetical protein
MSRNLLSVVEEYLRSPEVQHRKNAVTAFAILADEKATAKLIDTALMDAEPGVRQRAEQEILSFGPTEQDRVVKTVKVGLEDPRKRQAAFLLLGRLRSNGWKMSLSRWSLLIWLRLTWRLNLQLYPVRNWRFRTRAWKYGLLGAAAAAVIMGPIFLRSWKLDDYRGFIGYGLGLAFLSPVIAVFATQRTTPIGLYADALLGFFAEILATFLFAFLGFGIVIMLYILYASPYAILEYEKWFLLTPLIIPAFIALVRAGTIFGYGRFVNRRWNWFTQIAMGVATGTLGLTFINFIAWILDEYNEALMSTIGSWWIFLFVTSFITANAFAGIDNQNSPIRPIFGRLGTIVCILVLIPFIAIVGTVLILGRGAYDQHEKGPLLNTVFEKVTSTRRPTPTPFPED